MEDYEHIEEMKDFTPDNIVSHSMERNGEVINIIENGKRRVLNININELTIFDKDLNILYSKILDDEHPLIYYVRKHHFEKTKPKQLIQLISEEIDGEHPNYKNCNNLYRFI